MNSLNYPKPVLGFVDLQIGHLWSPVTAYDAKVFSCNLEITKMSLGIEAGYREEGRIAHDPSRCLKNRL